MIYLKQSTASQEIPLGYFLDSTDGNTEETGLTIANTDIKIWKSGATTLANKNSGGATHISNGIYYATLDATDTNTLGPMVIFVHVSGALVVRLECCVLAANVYDSLIGATDQLQVDAIQISGDATAADNLELDYDGTGYNKSNSTIGTCTTNTDMRGTDSALLASSAPTNFSDLAITASTGKVTVGTNDDKTGYSITGTVSADVVSISGDSVAADNLEAMFDGTGYTDETAPASRSQIGSLATGSAAISTVAESYTLTTGTQSSGTFADTETRDGTVHQHTDSAGAMDLYYQFDVGGSGVAVEVEFFGYLNGVNDSLSVQAYDWVGAAWDDIGTLNGQSGTDNVENVASVLLRHTGTGANLGKVRLRFYAASGLTSATLNLDQVTVSYSVVTKSVGYDGGSIWIDTNASNTNTEAFVDGVADNPVSTIGAADTLAASIGLDQFKIVPGSSITFAASQQNQVFEGKQWTLALGGQDIGGTRISGASSGVSGTATGTNPFFYECSIGAATLPPCAMQTCGLSSTLTVGSAGDFFLVDCFSQVAGASSPVLDMGAAVGATNVSIRRYSGGLTINNLASGDVVSLDGVFGTVTLNGADAEVEIRGIAKAVVNNLTGSPTVNDNSVKETAIDTIDANVDAILLDTGTDGVVLAGTPDVNVAQISGSATAADNLEASALGIVKGACEGTPSTTVIQTDLVEATDDHYNGRVVVFTSGDAAGEATDITDYTGATGTLTVTALTTAPSATDTFVIV